LGPAAQTRDLIGVAAQLSCVQLPKLLEAFRAVVEPAAKLVARPELARHSPRRASAFEMPRGQSRSIRTR
jgi:hypothetical protein